MDSLLLQLDIHHGLLTCLLASDATISNKMSSSHSGMSNWKSTCYQFSVFGCVEIDQLDLYINLYVDLESRVKTSFPLSVRYHALDRNKRSGSISFAFPVLGSPNYLCLPCKVFSESWQPFLAPSPTKSEGPFSHNTHCSLHGNFLQ